MSVNDLVALPLQRIAATGSYFVLQLSGFWVIQQGNVLQLTTPFGTRPLDVALACSGLKMLMTLAATVTATIMLLPLPTWKRLVLLASAVPIALISNIGRIVTTGWCYYYIEGRSGQRTWAHDISGLDDDAAGPGPGVAGAADPVLADPREGRGRRGDRPAAERREEAERSRSRPLAPAPGRCAARSGLARSRARSRTTRIWANCHKSRLYGNFPRRTRTKAAITSRC